MISKSDKTVYCSPVIEVIEIVMEGSILAASGDSFDIGDWEESDEDYGGSAI